jgi:hypothetical protein
VVLTAVLADATNLGLTRMAEACSVATYHQLAWTAGWHLSEEAYRQALAAVVNAQQSQPLAAFGKPPRYGFRTLSHSDRACRKRNRAVFRGPQDRCRPVLSSDEASEPAPSNRRICRIGLPP